MSKNKMEKALTIFVFFILKFLKKKTTSSVKKQAMTKMLLSNALQSYRESLSLELDLSN